MFLQLLLKQEVVLMAKRKNRKIISNRKQLERNNATANRKYKDTVFRKLFSDRKNLLSLYNAINGTAYTDETQLEIVTLENAIYMGMKNDLAFIINTNLFLYEHQSTYNPNMPLRDLFYISGEYQKLVDWKKLYKSTRMIITAPNFIVFYNGTQEKEDCWTDYLSESYENFSGEPNLELKVITFNVNEGHNQELMEQCRILKEYAQYVAKVRRYSEEMELNEAVERAVDESIQENILREFLQKNRAEVIGMSIFEYHEDQEEELRKMEYKSGREDKSREVAISLAEDGESVERIAKVLHESEETIQRWLKSQRAKSILERGSKMIGFGDRIYEKGMRIGKQEGMILGALMSGKTPEEVSKMLNLPLEEIKKVQEEQMTANK